MATCMYTYEAARSGRCPKCEAERKYMAPIYVSSSDSLRWRCVCGHEIQSRCADFRSTECAFANCVSRNNVAGGFTWNAR